MRNSLPSANTHKQSIQNFWESMKSPNVRIMIVKGEKLQGGNTFKKIIREIFPNLGTYTFRYMRQTKCQTHRTRKYTFHITL